MKRSLEDLMNRISIRRKFSFGNSAKTGIRYARNAVKLRLKANTAIHPHRYASAGRGGRRAKRSSYREQQRLWICYGEQLKRWEAAFLYSILGVSSTGPNVLKRSAITKMRAERARGRNFRQVKRGIGCGGRSAKNITKTQTSRASSYWMLPSPLRKVQLNPRPSR